MGLINTLKMSVEDSVIDVVLNKGNPVVPVGEERTDLDKVFHASIWKDTAAQAHVKGGYRLNPDTKRWETVDGCEWVLENMQITKDSFDEETGKITLEVSGMTCKCGQAVNKTIRYSDKADTVRKSILNAMDRHNKVAV